MAMRPAAAMRRAPAPAPTLALLAAPEYLAGADEVELGTYPVPVGLDEVLLPDTLLFLLAGAVPVAGGVVFLLLVVVVTGGGRVMAEVEVFLLSVLTDELKGHGQSVMVRVVDLVMV